MDRGFLIQNLKIKKGKGKKEKGKRGKGKRGKKIKQQITRKEKIKIKIVMITEMENI